VLSPSQTLLITSVKENRQRKNREGGQRREDMLRARNEFLQVLPNRSSLLPCFFCLFFCTNCLCFLLHRGAQTRAKPRARTKQGRSWLVTRETWSTAAVAWFPFFVLCSNARRTQSCVTGVSAGNRDRKRRRKKEKKFMVKELEKTHRDQQRTTKLARQFNPNTYRMKVRG
jgi:hypothetical protein